MKASKAREISDKNAGKRTKKELELLVTKIHKAADEGKRSITTDTFSFRTEKVLLDWGYIINYKPTCTEISW